MARPVTLFTGQWADLPLDRPRRASAAGWGFDGLELACWGDHFEVDKALADDGYARGRRGAPRAPRPRRLGDRRPPRRAGGVRPDRRAPPRDPAAGGLGRRRPGRRAAARGRADEGHGTRRGRARRHPGQRLHRLVDLAPALLVPAERLRRRSSAATRTSPSAWARSSTCSTQEGVRFGLEVHPTEIAYDFVTTRKRSTRSATARRSGSTSTRATSPTSASTPPSSRSSSPTGSTTSTSRTRSRRLDGRRSILGSHLNFGEEARGWDFVSPGHGDVDFEELRSAR